MRQIIIARYGEIHLKGNNRGTFIRALTRNLESSIGRDCKIAFTNGRYTFTDFAPDMIDVLTSRISKVFGIVSVSPCVCVGHKDILLYLKSITLKKNTSFKIQVNRADKTFQHTSMEFAAIAGGEILENNPSAKVDVHNPEIIVNIDIRENDSAYVYDKVIPAAGGMPVGTAGKAFVLLSGGIDSPVAAYLSAKRGLSIDCIHFASPPYTSELALEKVNRLRKVLTEYCGQVRIFVVPFTEIQKQIKAKCSPEYMITIMRRFMIRIAENLAKTKILHTKSGDIDCGDNRDGVCLVTGENLSQVASQTLHGMTTNNVCAREVPILRPLVTYDKSEIIAIAKKIGTYDISIEPHADCCTVFVPRSPIIRPSIIRCEREEQNLDVNGLIMHALEGIYIL